MALLKFYQQLYASGVVQLAGPVGSPQSTGHFWKFMEKIFTDTARVLALPDLPQWSGKADSALRKLAGYAYELCCLSLQQDAQVQTAKENLATTIDELEPVASWPQLLMAHALLAGIMPFYSRFDRDSQTVWHSLSGKSPLTQLFHLGSCEVLPVGWSWDFLLVLRRQTCLRHLVRNQLVGLASPSLRRELGRQFDQWHSANLQEDFIVEVYWHFDHWEGHYPWSPSFIEIERNLEAGRIFPEQGWDDFFRPLHKIFDSDRHAGVEHRRLRHFPR